MTNTAISKKILLVPPVTLIIFLLFCCLLGDNTFSAPPDFPLPPRYRDANQAADDVGNQARQLDRATEARRSDRGRQEQNQRDRGNLEHQRDRIDRLDRAVRDAYSDAREHAERAERLAREARELAERRRREEAEGGQRTVRTADIERKQREAEAALRQAEAGRDLVSEGDMDRLVEDYRRANGETYEQAVERLERSMDDARRTTSLGEDSTTIRDRGRPAVARARDRLSHEPVDEELRELQNDVNEAVEEARETPRREVDEIIERARENLEAVRAAMVAAAPPVSGPVYASVQVREEEKAYLAAQIGGQVVAQVLVNDKPRELPKLDEGIPVNPGDVVQAISALGNVLARIDFTPKVVEPPPTRPPVKECPLGKPAVVSVPGNYTGVPLDNMQVSVGTTGPKEAVAVTTPEAALVTGEEKKAAAVTTPEAAVTTPSQLAPVLKTDDTVVAAGALDNSAIGSNAISVTDKNTGAVLGQTQVDTWRLAGASLNPPVVNKGQDTNLRLDVFGPPDLPMKVTATAGEGLTPKQLTATAPISVLQTQGLGAFTATQSGQHSVSIRATAAAGCTRTKHCGCGGTPQPRCAHKACGCEVGQVSPMLPEQVSPMLK